MSGPARVQALKLLYIVFFSALVVNLATVAMHNTSCPVATIHTWIVIPVISWWTWVIF